MRFLVLCLMILDVISQCNFFHFDGENGGWATPFDICKTSYNGNGYTSIKYMCDTNNEIITKQQYYADDCSGNPNTTTVYNFNDTGVTYECNATDCAIHARIYSLPSGCSISSATSWSEAIYVSELCKPWGQSIVPKNGGPPPQSSMLYILFRIFHSYIPV